MKYIISLLIYLFSYTAALAHQGPNNRHDIMQFGDRVLHYMTTLPHNIFWWIVFAIITLVLWKLIETSYARLKHNK